MVADGIEFHLGKASRGEFRGELGLKLGVLEPGRFLGGDLDQGLFAQMADTDDAKAVAADGLLRFFDGGESVGGDGQARSEPGGEAGGGGFFGNFQAGFPREGADISLGDRLAEAGAGIPDGIEFDLREAGGGELGVSWD